MKLSKPKPPTLFGRFFQSLDAATAKPKAQKQQQQNIPPEVVVQNFQYPVEWFAQQVAVMNGHGKPVEQQPATVVNVKGGYQQEPLKMQAELEVEQPLELPEDTQPALPEDPFRNEVERIRKGRKK